MPDSHSEALLSRLNVRCLPGGEDVARGVRAIRSTQRGEIRMGPDARWNEFTAEDFVDCTRTAFSWQARIGKGIAASVQVTDAYQDGHGRAVLAKGPVTLRKLAGPEADLGELQRYLSYVINCPPMILNNLALELTAAGPLTLHVRDRQDRTGASVELDISTDGEPLRVRAVRPMAVGRRTILTPWSACASKVQEHDGIRIPYRLEASWEPPEGAYTYIWMELTSCTLVR